ncbi:uncharacterized protein LOC131068476 [Cryptomeria japonica]|uniref:uncharacterized protein LOC131068476 n=1 Tax=Cryptomeria japonica TaxID=3369 RepID=UPI0025ACA37C|nr:uncharacterized protein LOC131068476 [Cryptomeria japonica]
MDPDTEKKLAALIMEEAKMLRLQADKEGVHAYLAKPKVRGRPNSQFLTATVRGVQQANRMADVNEMWRLREKELELEQRIHENQSRKYQKNMPSESSEHRMQDSKYKAYSSSKEIKGCKKEFSSSEFVHSSDLSESHEDEQYYSAKRKRVCKNAIDSEDSAHDCQMHRRGLRDEGLCDEEIEAFLQSRTKRGRGAIGSRMDEPGPYLMSPAGESSLAGPSEVRVKEDWEQRIIGPSMPSSSRTDVALAGSDKIKSKNSRNKESKEKCKRHSRMHSDVDGKSKFKKSKKKHGKGNKVKKEKSKKKRRKKKVDDE